MRDREQVVGSSPCGTYSERRDVILWRLISMRDFHWRCRDARFVRPQCWKVAHVFFDIRTQEHITMRGGKWSYTESTEQHRMPCGVELSHADGADIRRSMRSEILCFSVLSVCNISHAKAQSFTKRLRSSAESACNNFHTESTENTEKSPHIGTYLLVFF